jgi:hypothetical protein
MFLTVLGFVLAGVVGFGLWWAYGRLLLLGSQYRYRKVHNGSSSRSSSPLRIPAFLRRGSYKKDEECGITDPNYELYSRRD